MWDENSLLNELRMVNIALKRSAGQIGEAKVPSASSMVVHFVGMQGGAAQQKDVENEFGLRRSTVSRLLSKLETDGYITREIAGGGDGRSKRIYLTEKAKAEQQAVAEQFGKVEKRLDGVLTPSEKSEFSRLCGKIRAALEIQ